MWNDNNPVQYSDPSGYESGDVSATCSLNKCQPFPIPTCDAACDRLVDAALFVGAILLERGGGDEPPTQVPVGTRRVPLSVSRATNQSATFFGRNYSGHAIDEMQSSGFTPSVVEDAISTTKGVPGKLPDTIVHDSLTNGVRVITNNEGRVVTVTPITRAKPPNKP